MASSREDLREALKRVAVALKRAEVPFALTGGYAVWARGGPESEHDVDFLIADQDVERAVLALTEQGLKVVRPPEDWLVKVFTDNAMVDIIHRHSDAPAERATVEDADVLEVLSVQMPVLSATEVVVQKMMALDEHECDFAAMIPVMRALREQLDLPRVRRETAQSPFAAALLLLLEKLDIIEPATGSGDRVAGADGAGTGYSPVMSQNHDEPIEIEDIPEEEGVTAEDAEEELAQSPGEKRNFTETHPEEARRERERQGEDS